MKKLIIILFLIILAVVGWFFFVREKEKPIDLSSAFSSDNFVGLDKINAERQRQSKESLVDLNAGKKLSYVHPRLGFSFEYPEGFNIGQFSSGADGGETILVQKDSVGFQLKITPFDEDLILTADIIKGDIPDIIIEQPIQIKIATAIGLVFLSDSESLGKTREVWWVYRGFLYQITTYTEFDEVMVSILETWKYN